MNRILFPKFLNGRTPEDTYGTVGGYYPVGEYDGYYPQNIQQPSAADLVRNYLFGQQYGKYDNIVNALNYLTRLLNYSNSKDVIQRGPYKGGLEPKRSVNDSSTKKYKVKSKRDYYNKHFGGGVR